MFNGGFSDSSTDVLELPHTNPDALEVLLNYIFDHNHEHLTECPQQLQRPVYELADRLLMHRDCIMMETRMQFNTDPDTLVDAMLWADEHGYERLLRCLTGEYRHRLLRNKVSDSAAETLWEKSPKIANRCNGRML